MSEAPTESNDRQKRTGGGTKLASWLHSVAAATDTLSSHVSEDGTKHGYETPLNRLVRSLKAMSRWTDENFVEAVESLVSGRNPTPKNSLGTLDPNEFRDMSLERVEQAIRDEKTTRDVLFAIAVGRFGANAERLHKTAKHRLVSEIEKSLEMVRADDGFRRGFGNHEQVGGQMSGPRVPDAPETESDAREGSNNPSSGDVV